MKRIAIVLHNDGTVAPVDDTGRHYDSIAVFESDDGILAETDFQFDPKSEDFDLVEAMKIAHVTDVIGQHFEDLCFDKLKTDGVHMWLEAPDTDARSALKGWLKDTLPEAKVGAHAVHGPEGKRVREEASRERVPSHQRTSGGVSSPIHGPGV